MAYDLLQDAKIVTAKHQTKSTITLILVSILGFLGGIFATLLATTHHPFSFISSHTHFAQSPAPAPFLQMDGKKEPSEPPEDCGDSIASARERNCTFEPISFSWLPQACSDPHLSVAFLNAGNWTWYFDRDGKRPASHEGVLRGDHDNLYVTQEYHILHCTYMWRKMHRAFATGAKLDGYVGKFNHTSHCEMMIMEGVKGSGNSQDLVDTVIKMKWPTCPVVW